MASGSKSFERKRTAINDDKLVVLWDSILYARARNSQATEPCRHYVASEPCSYPA